MVINRAQGIEQALRDKCGGLDFVSQYNGLFVKMVQSLLAHFAGGMCRKP